jgi:branched-chain amino acid transport system substrate-binding protein
MREFGKKFKDRFGVLPANPAARSYDALMLYAAALRSGATTAAEIRDFYASVKDFPGVSGPVTFDGDGITEEQPVVNTVRNGQIVPMQ